MGEPRGETMGEPRGVDFGEPLGLRDRNEIGDFEPRGEFQFGTLCFSFS